MNETPLGENTWVGVWRQPDGALRVSIKWPAVGCLVLLAAVPAFTFGFTIGALIR